MHGDTLTSRSFHFPGRVRVAAVHEGKDYKMISPSLSVVLIIDVVTGLPALRGCTFLAQWLRSVFCFLAGHRFSPQHW